VGHDIIETDAKLNDRQAHKNYTSTSYCAGTNRSSTVSSGRA